MTDGIPSGLQAIWYTLGTDETGSDHVIDFVSRTVYVLTPEGDIKHTEHLDAQGASVDDWMEHVEKLSEWQERRYGRGFGAMVADATEGAA